MVAPFTKDNLTPDPFTGFIIIIIGAVCTISFLAYYTLHGITVGGVYHPPFLSSDAMFICVAVALYVILSIVLGVEVRAKSLQNPRPHSNAELRKKYGPHYTKSNRR